MWIAIAALLSALGTGSIAALLRYRSQNRETDANAISLDRTTLLKVAEGVEDIYSNVITELRSEVDRLIRRDSELRNEVERLTTRDAECRRELEKVKVEMAYLRAVVQNGGADETPTASPDG